MTQTPVLLALALTGCAAGPQPEPPPLGFGSPPQFRLREDVRPLRYELDLDADPSLARIQGRITIDIQFVRDTRLVWLNAGSRVHVQRAEWLFGGEWLPAATLSSGEFLGVALRGPRRGRARLRITFESESATREADGLFRRHYKGSWYLFSHFEPLRARRAFPCFDEPSFKTPWRVEVRTPTRYDALSNMPLESSRLEANGSMRFVFRESPPLPSYLVALAVGRFRFVDGGRAGVHQTPIRFALPEQLTTSAAEASATLRKLLDVAEKRFGTPFPFPKLDVVAAPGFDAGAMENAGLITIEAGILDNSQVLAHELVHQWFGDDVTCAWFDDVWLNESVSEWLSVELAAQVDPHFKIEDFFRGMKRRVLGSDLRGRGQAVRVRPKSAADVMETFAPYTYLRGASLLRMLQGWMGPEAFGRALTRYLSAHAYGTVTTADLAAALSAEAGRDLQGVLASYLDQPGIPLVEAHTVCAPGEPGRVELRQRPLVPRAGGTSWRIPLCASYEGRRDCMVLEGETGELQLHSTGCPRVSFGSADERLFALRPDLSANPAELPANQRRELILELRQLLLANAVSVKEVLPLLPALLAGDDPPLRESVLMLFELAPMVTAPLRVHWRRYLRRLGLVRYAHTLPAGDADQLWTFLLGEAVDPELAAQATAAALAWLADPKREDIKTVWQGVLAGSPRFLTALATVQGDRRGTAMTALGGVQDPLLFQAAATEVLRSAPDQIFSFLAAAGRTSATSPWAWEFLRQHHQILLRSVVGEARDRYLLQIATMACNLTGAAELGVRDIPAYKTDFDELALCTALRRNQQANLLDFLAGE